MTKLHESIITGIKNDIVSELNKEFSKFTKLEKIETFNKIPQKVINDYETDEIWDVLEK